MRTALIVCVAFAAIACGGDGSSSLDEPLGSPDAIDIGFNMGRMDQFGYLDDYFKASSVKDARLCHTYAAWDAGTGSPVAANPNAPAGTRAWLTAWLGKAQGACDEVLVSFKAHTHGKAPSPAQVETAFRDFVTASWPYTGKFSFTPWNEPNNGGDAGNGLGEVISPDLDAEYYLTMEEICRNHGCKVAAGDFASNGNWWKDFSWNCANDNVAPSQLCASPSSENGSHLPASYLDKFKNYIANFASGKTSTLGRKHHLPQGFRPEVFAFHGWHDINDYLSDANHCGTYGDCATRRILQSLGGSWAGVKLWDTEVGIDQDGPAISDDEQACGAAFLLRLSALSARLERVYITRVHGGTGQLVRDDHSLREAAHILANRKTTYPAGHCK